MPVHSYGIDGDDMVVIHCFIPNTQQVCRLQTSSTSVWSNRSTQDLDCICYRKHTFLDYKGEVFKYLLFKKVMYTVDVK